MKNYILLVCGPKICHVVFGYFVPNLISYMKHWVSSILRVFKGRPIKCIPLKTHRYCSFRWIFFRIYGFRTKQCYRIEAIFNMSLLEPLGIDEIMASTKVLEQLVPCRVFIPYGEKVRILG